MNSKASDTEERIDIRITVCQNGVVNIRNPESDRAHSVFLNSKGDVLQCSCKGHRYHGHCYHTREIESRPLVVASARASSGEKDPLGVRRGDTYDRTRLTNHP